MNKVIGLKLTDTDKELIKQIENSGLSNSELLRKALKHYFEMVNQSVNHKYKEKTLHEVNQVNQTVNHSQQENVKANDLQNRKNALQNDLQNDLHNTQKKNIQKVNHVNPNIQIIENYEFMEYLKRDNEWLKGRIEHFEHIQDKIFAKIDMKVKKETEKITRYRM